MIKPQNSFKNRNFGSRKPNNKQGFLGNKRGTIGATLTWIIAFLIIFLVLIGIYLPATFFIAGQKQIFGKPEIGKEIIRGNLIETKNLIGFFNTKIEFEGSKKISDMFFNLEKENYAQRLEEEIKEFFNMLESECYVVQTGNFEVSQLIESGGIRYSRSYRESLLQEKGIKIMLLKNNEKIEVRAYSGRC